jgi:hypothetical protein
MSLVWLEIEYLGKTSSTDRPSWYDGIVLYQHEASMTVEMDRGK